MSETEVKYQDYTVEEIVALVGAREFFLIPDDFGCLWVWATGVLDVLYDGWNKESSGYFCNLSQAYEILREGVYIDGA